jgi:hypothetical protein
VVRASFCGVVPKAVENGLDGYTFGYTARLACCGACNLLGSGPHADSRAVYDDERRGEFSFGDLSEQSTQGLFAFFDCGRPNPKAHNAMVPLRRKGTAIGEVFIEGHNDSGLLLCPGKDLFIRLTGQSDIACMEDGPCRLQQLQPCNYGLGNILVEKDGQAVRHAE